MNEDDFSVVDVELEGEFIEVSDSFKETFEDFFPDPLVSDIDFYQVVFYESVVWSDFEGVVQFSVTSYLNELRKSRKIQNN